MSHENEREREKKSGSTFDTPYIVGFLLLFDQQCLQSNCILTFALCKTWFTFFSFFSCLVCALKRMVGVFLSKQPGLLKWSSISEEIKKNNNTHTEMVRSVWCRIFRSCGCPSPNPKPKPTHKRTHVICLMNRIAHKTYSDS